MRGKRKQQQLVLEWLKHGVKVRTACALAGVSHTTVYTWVKEDARFAREFARARATPIAQAELALHKAIQHGDIGAIKWYLERSMPEYRLPRVEVDADNDAEVVVRFEEVPSPETSFDELLQEVLRGRDSS